MNNFSGESLLPEEPQPAESFSKGTEPINLRKRIDILMPKLQKEYPDRVVVGLSTRHKKWAETIRDLTKKLGYSSTAEFLNEYGFKMGTSSHHGRPKATTADTTAIIEELKKRYPDGPRYRSMQNLIAANPDLKHKIKTLQNVSQEIFGTSFGDYLRKENLIGWECTDSFQEKERIKFDERQEKRRAKMDELITILWKRYPDGSEKPSTFSQMMNDNSDLDLKCFTAWCKGVYGKGPKDYFKELGLIAQGERKSNDRKDVAGKQDIERIPEAIRQIKELFEQGEIIRASLGEVDDQCIVYESVCPECGKHKLVRGPTIDWYMHGVSVYTYEGWKRRNQKVQAILDKYGIGLTLDPEFQEKFKSQKGTCICHLISHKMYPFYHANYGGMAVEAIRDDGSMTISFEVAGTLYGGRTPRIEQHAVGDLLVFRRDKYNSYSKTHIAVLDTEGNDLGSMPRELSKEIAPLVDKGIVTMEGHITGIQTRAQRGGRAQKALLFAWISLRPKNKSKPMDWIMNNRVQCLIYNRSLLEIYESGTSIKIANKKRLQNYCITGGIAPYERAYIIETLVKGSDAGDCRYAVDALDEGTPIKLIRAGSLTQGNDIIAVYDCEDNRLGNIGDVLSCTLVPLMDYGRLRVFSPTYKGRFEKSRLTGSPTYTWGKIEFLAIVDPVGSQSEERQSLILPPIKGSPSEELEELITHIKANQLDIRYFLAVNFEGNLFLVDPNHDPGEDWAIRYDFGFECSQDYGFFALFKQVPDDDPIGIMRKNGILVGRLENYADVLENEEDDEG